jgi:uridine kinase
LEAFDSCVKIIGERISTLLDTKDRVLIAIDGHSGAGKSTLGRNVADIFNANLFHMDDYFLTPELRTKARMKEIGGNVDCVRFKREIIEGINAGKPFECRRFDCKRQEFSPPTSVVPKRVNIIEGSYSLHPTLIEFYDYTIFVEISPALQEKRILARCGPAMFETYMSLWIPLENLYFKTFAIKEKCDLVCCTTL